MKQVRITTTERVRSPASRAPRIMVWLFAAFAAPVTGFASLAVIPFAEAGFSRLKRDAAAEAARLTANKMPSAQAAMENALKRGARTGTVRLGAHTNGYGYVERQFDFNVRNCED